MYYIKACVSMADKGSSEMKAPINTAKQKKKKKIQIRVDLQDALSLRNVQSTTKYLPDPVTRMITDDGCEMFSSVT
jgi:hypothetical protein